MDKFLEVADKWILLSLYPINSCLTDFSLFDLKDDKPLWKWYYKEINNAEANMLQHASSSLSAFFNNYTLHYNNFILKVGLKVLLKIKK